DHERATLIACLAAFAAGEPKAAARVVVIEGEPGIGKSRLVDEVRRAALDRSVECLVGASSPMETATPYHAWRPVFRAFLELDAADGDAERRRRRVRERLDALGEGMPDLAPLLNPVTLLDFPETALTEQMRGEARADSTNRLLARLLASDPARRLVCLEDAHWFDSSS